MATTPVFLPGKFHRQRSLVGYSPWSHKESDMTELLSTAQHTRVCTYLYRPSQVGIVVKNPPASARDGRDKGSIPGLGRPPGEGHGNPLQYSVLENSIDFSIVHEAAKSPT